MCVIWTLMTGNYRRQSCLLSRQPQEENLTPFRKRAGCSTLLCLQRGQVWILSAVFEKGTDWKVWWWWKICSTRHCCISLYIIFCIFVSMTLDFSQTSSTNWRASNKETSFGTCTCSSLRAHHRHCCLIGSLVLGTQVDMFIATKHPTTCPGK